MKKPFNSYPIKDWLERQTGLRDNEPDPTRAWLYWLIIAPVASIEFMANFMLNNTYNLINGKNGRKTDN